jgi:tetratricopeptide (TPR) repeat protein
MAVSQDSAALVAYNRAFELFDPSVRPRYYSIAVIHARAGRPQEALAALAKLGDSDSTRSGLGVRAYILAKAGREPDARVIAERLTERARTAERGTAQGRALAHLVLGDPDNAIEWLITAARLRLLVGVVDPSWDPIRTHRRYPELLLLLNLHDQPIAQWKGRAPAVVR